MHLQGGDERLI